MQKRWLLLILVAGLVLRVGIALHLGDLVRPTPAAFDQVFFHDVALNVLEGRGFSYTVPPWPFIQPGAPTAYTSFLYQLFLAAVYYVAGPHPLAARIVQALICSVMPWQVHELVRRMIRGSSAFEGDASTIALVAAAIAAGYAYFAYFSATLMTEGLYLISVAWALIATLDLVERPRATRWAVWGLAVGLATLLRQVFMLMGGLLLLFVVWQLRERTELRHVALAGAIVAALILPWTVRNYLVFDRFLLLNSQAGQVFWNANHPDLGTTFRNAMFPVPEDLRGANEVDLSNELLRRGLRNVVADPERFVGLSLSRFVDYFRFWPAAYSPPLSNIARTVSFGMGLPFMLFGLWLGRREWRQWLILYLFAAVYTVLHVISWTQIRYRMPVDLVLIPFAALAVATLVHGLWHRPLRSLELAQSPSV